MRIAILSDIHSNLPALEAVVADARAHGATHLMCLGDIVGYGPQPMETLRRVRELSNATVLGNHDAAVCGLLSPKSFNAFARETAERAALALPEEDKAWLRELPYIVETDAIAIAHGGFCEPEKFHYLESKEDAAFCLEAMPEQPLLIVGHTHIPCLFVREESGMVRKLPPQDISLRQGCRYVANPGSVGFPRGDNLTADYILYDTMTRRLLFRSCAYDFAPYRLALVRNGYNPLNYWFLSPSARRRQTEQAFLNPTRVACAVIANGAAFRVHRKGRTQRGLSWLVIGLFVTLLLSILYITVYMWTHDGPQTQLPIAMPAAPALPEGTQIAVPPFARWDFGDATHGTVGDDNLRCLATLRTLSSPEIPLPEPCPQEVKLTFTVTATRSEPRLSAMATPTASSVIMTSQARFTRADGSVLRDGTHVYKRPGQKSYTLHCPEGAVSLRLYYTFQMPASFTFSMPTLTVKE